MSAINYHDQSELSLEERLDQARHAHDHGDGSHRHLAEFFVCETCHDVEERHAHDHADCKPEGFTITRSVVEHYGICASCES